MPQFNPSPTQDPFQILYMQQFLAEAIKQHQKKKKHKGGEENILGDKYSPDQQIYIDLQNVYPKIRVDTKTAENTNVYNDSH